LNLIITGTAGLVAVGLFLLTARRPVFGCAVLALAVPLTAGLGRSVLIPVLKPGEAILLTVLAGVAAHRLRSGTTRPVTGLDLAVGGYAIGSVGLPWAVLTFTRHAGDLDTWWTVFAPALFFAAYYVFSRTAPSGDGLNAVLNGVMLAGVLVCGIAVAELVNVPGFRSFVQANYPAPILSSFRPGSTLGHYGALGAFGLVTYALALALAATRRPGFPWWWLTLVMGAGALGVLVSQAWASQALLPVVALVIVLYARRVPGEIVSSAGVGLLGLSFLWPGVIGEFTSRGVTTAQGFALPESMAARIRYWNEFFIPALSSHTWLGTGTLIPASVPAPLPQLVDNEYLAAAFRAGLPGVALLVGMLVSVGAVSWSVRSSTDSSRRALGAASLAMVVMLILLGTTAQYTAFAGLSLVIGMLVGALAGLTTQAYARREPLVMFSSEPQVLALPGQVEA
jgi:hypothetical protein